MVNFWRSMPTSRSLPMIRGQTQSGLARDILRTSCRTSGEIAGRPDFRWWDSFLQ
jgi:hypothetical protein